MARASASDIPPATSSSTRQSTWNRSSASMSEGLVSVRASRARTNRRRPAKRGMTVRQLVDSKRLQHAGDGFGVTLPFGELGSQLRAPARGELVVFGLAVVFGESPFALDESFALETVEGGVEGAFFDQEDAFASFL